MRKKIKYTVQIFWIVTFLLVCGSSFAQQVLVKGKVKDAKGVGISFATVAEIKNGRVVSGVATDANGNFTIKASSSAASLRATMIGYVDKTEVIGGRANITFELKSKDVTTGVAKIQVRKKESLEMGDGGLTIKDKDRSFSVSHVDMEKIPPSSVTSVDQMLQGQATGVQVVFNSGDPGAGATIRIRGTNSLNSGNDPLIVVDGIPLESGSVSAADLGNVSSGHSPIADINPADIESIDVLKDAAAAGLYGSRAQNGVILIKTKRARKATNELVYTGSVSLKTPPDRISLLNGNEYKILLLEAKQNDGEYDAFPQLRDNTDRNDYAYFNKNTDWPAAVEKNNFGQSHHFGIRGSGSSTVYSLGIGYNNDNGQVKNTSYDRLTTTFRLDYTVSDKLKITTSSDYSYSRTRKQYTSIMGLALQYPPFVPIYDQDTTGGNISGSDKSSYYVPPVSSANDARKIWNNSWYNPVALATYSKNYTYANNFRGALQAEYKITENLRFRPRLTLAYADEDGATFLPQSATGNNIDNATINKSTAYASSSQEVNQDNLLSYGNVFGKIHNVQVFATTSIRMSRGYSYSHSVSNSAGQESASSSNNWSTPQSSYWETRTNSVFGATQYILMDRYVFYASVRRDGSSKFGRNNRYGVFPAFSFRWKMQEEGFVQSTFLKDYISDLGLTASWGLNGQEPTSAYGYLATYSATQKYMAETGVVPDNLSLDNLKWEQTAKTDVGLRASFLEDRFGFEADWYNSKTTDAIMYVEVPTTSGYTGMWKNFCSLQNRGVEFDIFGKIIDAPNFKWDVRFNVSRNRNKVLTMPAEGMQPTWKVNGKYPMLVKVGDAIGTFYGLRYKGVYASDSSAIVRDANGNKVVDVNGEYKYMRYSNKNGYTFKGGDAMYEDINKDGVINNEDRVKIGDANPICFGSFTNNFNYKSLRFGFMLYYNLGNDIISQSQMQSEWMVGIGNQSTAVLRRWRKQGDEATIPAARYSTTNNYNYEGSDRFVQDGSYVRLKSVYVSYDIPREFLKRFNIKGANLSFNAYNLYVWTNYTGQDPEVSMSASDPWAIGIETATTAPAKSYTLQLQIRF